MKTCRAVRSPGAGGSVASAQAEPPALTQVDRLIICVFLEKDENIYRQRLPYYFPVGMYPAVPTLGCPCPAPTSRFSLSSAFQPDGTPPPTLTRTGKKGLALRVAAH